MPGVRIVGGRSLEGFVGGIERVSQLCVLLRTNYLPPVSSDRLLVTHVHLGVGTLTSLKLSLHNHFAHLLILAPRTVEKMAHAHHTAVTRRQKGGDHGDVANVASRNFETPGHELKVEVSSLRCVFRPDLLPDPSPVSF